MDGLKNFRRATVTGRRQRKAVRLEPAKPYLDALNQLALLSVDVFEPYRCTPYSAMPAPCHWSGNREQAWCEQKYEAINKYCKQKHKEGDGTAAHCQR
jgi:hypothetical protein